MVKSCSIEGFDALAQQGNAVLGESEGERKVDGREATNLQKKTSVTVEKGESAEKTDIAGEIAGAEKAVTHNRF